LALLVLFSMTATAQGAARVLHAVLSDAVSPVTANHIGEAIATAEKRDAEAIVLQIDTPGGLEASMREAAKAILASRVPVIAWVGPAGARAASAGMFLVLASHVAAMAPGTNIGAAHPVGLGGQGPDSTMAGKIENDAVAFARSLAALRSRNADWAERAVRESVSLDAEEALRQDVCDLLATDVRELLEATDGIVVTVDGSSDTLVTAGAEVVEFRMSIRERILAVITNPNIAYLLFLAGILGIFFELSNPGAILPGVIGGIAIILALFAFQSLPVNFAGILLILLAIVMFLAEIKVASSGALAIGGVISLMLGSLLLFRTPAGGMTVSFWVIVPAVLVTAGFFVFAVTMALRAQRRQPRTGTEGMIGEIATVVEDLSPAGKVRIRGEIWAAESPGSVPRGARVRVIAVEGLHLRVELVADGSSV
jgi:membrane-bound serine protease (ClpP class)